ncbi:prolyl-tRNA synthetase associated domain-containing protein [Aliagarivorans taiwanensis]|uniref:prolyl-tRNA synthetase associated domain-containing protein n=1 Tax=Aliagarivorans taiwanensis TaxID=561966 RepID=UPI0004048450|nr:prolyl-tRNA synthetase associated domain-containing protein [Aliagarivorans taiwanensis]
MNSTLYTHDSLLTWLREQQIDFEYSEHPALSTARCAEQYQLNRSGQRIKNLFLRDNYGRRHFLLLVPADKLVDLKALAKQQQLSRLGFASDERLALYLGVQPGCVSLLALINDSECQVELWIDEELWRGASSEQRIDEHALQCHPLVNTATVVLSPYQVERFLRLTGHQKQLLGVPARKLVQGG